MNRLKTVNSLIDQQAELALMGYSECMINDLILNGHLQGKVNTVQKTMEIEESEVEGIGFYYFMHIHEQGGLREENNSIKEDEASFEIFPAFGRHSG